jgi:hypothetical protein
MYALGRKSFGRVAKKVVVKRISAMGSPKNRRAPHSSKGEKRGRAASYRDKEKKFGKSARGFGPKKNSAARFQKRAGKKVVVKRISAMGSPKIRRAPRGSWGEKRGRAASYRDKEFFLKTSQRFFFQKSDRTGSETANLVR